MLNFYSITAERFCNMKVSEVAEILKANMLEVLSDDPALTYAFKTIWEACADMERYVQYGFSTKERDLVFTDNNWKPLSPLTIMARAQRTVSKQKGFADKSVRAQQGMLQRELARRAGDRPLIDTGALRQSITYVVTEGGDGQ